MPNVSHVAASGLPGSVIAAKWPAAPAAPLGRDEEQRARKIQPALAGQHGLGRGRVQHVERQAAVRPAQRAGEHLRGQAGAAHAQQDRARQAALSRARREVGDLLKPRAHPCWSVKPAQAVGDLLGRGRPQRVVVAPEAVQKRADGVSGDRPAAQVELDHSRPQRSSAWWAVPSSPARGSSTAWTGTPRSRASKRPFASNARPNASPRSSGSSRGVSPPPR